MTGTSLDACDMAILETDGETISAFGPAGDRKLTEAVRDIALAATREALLAEIQQQAAADLTVLPQSLAAETMLLGPGVTLQGQPFGPAWQLGLWSLRA